MDLPAMAVRGWRELLRRLIGRQAFLRRRLTDPVAGLITLTIGLMIAALTGVVAAKVYDAVSEHEGVAGLDRPVLDLMLRLRTPQLDRAVTWFTDLGSSALLPYWAGLIVVVLALLWRTWAPILLMAAGAAGSSLMTAVGKAVVGRSRPPLADAVAPFEQTFSFPSGHTLNTATVVGVLAYLVVARYPRRPAVAVPALVVTGVFAAAMGLSRVYLGHHWFTDVLVSWSLALTWLALLVTGHRIWQLRAPRGSAASADARASAEMREGVGSAEG